MPTSSVETNFSFDCKSICKSASISSNTSSFILSIGWPSLFLAFLIRFSTVSVCFLKFLNSLNLFLISVIELDFPVVRRYLWLKGSSACIDIKFALINLIASRTWKIARSFKNQSCLYKINSRLGDLECTEKKKHFNHETILN